MSGLGRGTQARGAAAGERLRTRSRTAGKAGKQGAEAEGAGSGHGA